MKKYIGVKMIEAEPMTFGMAIEALKKGSKVQRKGWNGKGMFIFIQEEGVTPVVCLPTKIAQPLFGDSLLECDATVNIHPHINMKCADESLTIGWAPSQVDMLSTDWRIVP